MFKRVWSWLKKSWMFIWRATKGSRMLIVSFLFFITFFLGVSGSLDSLWEDNDYESDEVSLTLEMEEAIDADANEVAMTDDDMSNSIDQVDEDDEKNFLDAAAAKAKMMASGVVNAAGDVVNSFGEAIGGFFSYRLPNGQSIQIPEGGLEEKFLKALESDQANRHYFVFDRIYFKTGSAIINKSSGDQINSTVGILKAFSDKVILLRGHTDNVGDGKLNDRLSYKRANSLKAILVKKGISPKRVQVNGLGASESIGDNSTVTGRSLNRRIDISVIK